MARARTIHRCRSCDAVAARWAGRCVQCGEWNTLVEEAVAAPEVAQGPAGGAGAEVPPIVRLGDVAAGAGLPVPTGLDELDRALGGGLVEGSVTLVGGEPGVGKSTLLLQLAAAVAGGGRRALLVSAEESVEQVRRRGERLGTEADHVAVVATTSVPAIVAAAAEYQPDVLVVDSIQTIADPAVAGGSGTVGQVREATARLVELAKGRGIATLLVGHVTKEGSLAGPRTLEHLVDTVCSFEGDRHHAIRVLSVVKHRFGPAGELGVFTMGPAGLEGVTDPSALLLGDRQPGIPGSIVVPVLEGHRPILVEVQALVADSPLPSPRRVAQGLPAGRLALLVAVLQRRAGLSLAGQDLFASAVGGIRVTEPASDLAVVLAVASAAFGCAVPGDVVACGEIGLGGEIRQVVHTERRLAEAARRGFRRALVPPSAPEAPPGMTCTRLDHVAMALALFGDATHRPVPIRAGTLPG
ncbi:MAG: DNA repair protein RadA [Actinomycetota bacterium]|nr:DNA repair protein RadA [Actinomycetota bacterium]